MKRRSGINILGSLLGVVAMPEDNIDAAVQLHDRAEECRGVGKFGEALALCQRALELIEREGAGDSPDAANVLNTLASIQEGLACYQDALASRSRSVAIMNKLAGDDEVEFVRCKPTPVWPGCTACWGDMTRPRPFICRPSGVSRRGLEKITPSSPAC